MGNVGDQMTKTVTNISNLSSTHFVYNMMQRALEFQWTLCVTLNVILDHDEKSEEKILIIQDSHLKQLFVKLTVWCLTPANRFEKLHLCDMIIPILK